MRIESILDAVFPSRVVIRELKEDRELQRQQLVAHNWEIGVLKRELIESADKLQDCFAADRRVIDMGIAVRCIDEVIEQLDEHEDCIIQFRPWDPDLVANLLVRQGNWVRRISHVHDLDFTLLQVVV